MPNRVLLTVGRRLDPVALGALPPNVHVEPWVEQSDALAAAALVVCHGGSGTVFGALGAGLPVVVVPSFIDQLTNGRRVAAAGAALLVGDGAGARQAADDRRAGRAADHGRRHRRVVASWLPRCGAAYRRGDGCRAVHRGRPCRHPWLKSAPRPVFSTASRPPNPLRQPRSRRCARSGRRVRRRRRSTGAGAVSCAPHATVAGVAGPDVGAAT